MDKQIFKPSEHIEIRRLCRREIAIPQPFSDLIQLNSGRSKFCFTDREARAKLVLNSIGSDVNGTTQPKDPYAITTVTPRAMRNH